MGCLRQQNRGRIFFKNHRWASNSLCQMHLSLADELCESVITTVVGQRLESFTRISTVVRKALEAALLRILTPKKSTDVLREILQAKSEGRAYSIVFVGVNGRFLALMSAASKDFRSCKSSETEASATWLVGIWLRQLPKTAKRKWMLLSDALNRYYCSQFKYTALSRNYSAKGERNEHLGDYINRLRHYARSDRLLIM
ncbi:hypothetical protein PInf_017981 [Phytophthora infestans]|nr:hypothetical protein PInf_017981 [Phytophthora infestans]